VQVRSNCDPSLQLLIDNTAAAFPKSTTLTTPMPTHVRTGLIGGCNGTRFGCCSYPVARMPRMSGRDDCDTQNCTACLRAVKCAEGMSGNVLNATSRVFGTIENICSGIVGPQAKRCVAITRAAVSAINLIESGLNATDVCGHLGFCNVTRRSDLDRMHTDVRSNTART
jgi:hypothetical protein